LIVHENRKFQKIVNFTCKRYWLYDRKNFVLIK